MASSTEHATGLAPVVSPARRLLNPLPSAGPPAASRSLPEPSRRAHLPLLAVVAALALALLVALAPLPARAERIVLASYQEREGLQNLTPTCLTQDRRAVLWICTENGLFRFDGFRVHREPLPAAVGNGIWGGRVDGLGRLWLTTDQGLFLRRPSSDAARPEGGEAADWVEIRRADGQPLDVAFDGQFDVDERGVLVAVDRDHRFWTATVGDAGPSTVRAEPLPVAALDRPPAAGYVETIPLRRLGDRLWFGCGDGLCAWDRRQAAVTLWSAAQGLPPETWATLLVGRDGSLWARGRSHLARLAPGAQRFETVEAPMVNQEWEASSPLIEDPRGGILMAAATGIARWDGRAWQTWSRDDGLPDSAVRSLLVDGDGALWLGASGQGFHRWIGYGDVDHWSRASGLPSDVVFRLLQDRSGRHWAITREGLAWFDAAARRFQPLPPSAATAPRVAGIVAGAAIDAAGDLWWLDRGQLNTIKAGGTTARRVLTEPALLGLVAGHGGQLYLTSRSRIERLIPQPRGGVKREPVATDLPGGEPAISVFSDGTTDWFINIRWQVFRAQGDAWVPLRDEQGRVLTAYTATVADGALWASNDQGVATYTLSGDRAQLRRRIPKASFGGADPMWVVRGPGNEIWLGTGRGVFRLGPQGEWLGLLDRDSGLVWNDVNDDSFLLDAAGDAWIGTSGGATRVRRRPPPPGAPAVLRVDRLEFGTHEFSGPPNAPVPWTDRQLRITLGTPTLSLPRDRRIEYRLSPQAPWRTVEGASIDVGAMDEGRHLLTLRAAGRVPLEPPGPELVLPFTIAPPWWNSPGMRLTYLALLGALWWALTLWTQRRARARRRTLERAIDERTAELQASREALHRLSEHNALALEQERTRVSRELHDELGQQLAALRLEIAVMRARAARATASIDAGQLDLLHERVDRLVAAVRAVVSQLRPPALDGGLEAAFRWLGTEFSRDTGLPCEVSVAAGAGPLGSEAATQLFRVAQESLNNVRRHADATRAALSLSFDDGLWILTVRDDGRGFDPGGRPAGYGVMGMHERARLLGGTLSIHSAPGQGTVVELRVVPGTPAAPPSPYGT
ncbi:histidine kinase [Roseateles sp.]|uniref:sensor histidine kinase n=1 Tax=Roseateles sp. TaxID=1971397 RepID=UPI0031DBD017